MNVSMMDSYNLAWKLVHTIHGLTPSQDGNKPAVQNGTSPSTESSVLRTFATERLAVAKQLIEFDTKFSSMFSGAIGATDHDETVSSLTHEQFLQVFRDGSGFTSGCGIQYSESVVVQPAPGRASAQANGEARRYPIKADGDILNGCLQPGRRLADTVVRRFADANVRHLQDGMLLVCFLLFSKHLHHSVYRAFTNGYIWTDFLSTGRYRILVFSSSDIHSLEGRTAKALAQIGDTILPQLPKSLVELTVVHPIKEQRFEWTDVPPQIRRHAEMRFHGVGVDEKHGGEDVYAVYGVDEECGVAVVVRPDGYVGAVAALDDTKVLEDYLKRCLRTE